MEYVVLVDEKDNEIGIMEKLQAHREARLHRAISVFIFNSAGDLLLQQRAGDKYHSSLLWTNTCCSHPRPGEDITSAAHRRLMEEMGMECDLEAAFNFIYKAPLDNELTEYELDHVYKGTTDAVPAPDDREVAAWRYISIADLFTEVGEHPEKFTEWFKICLNDHRNDLF